MLKILSLIVSLTFSINACAYNGIKPQGDQDKLPEHLSSGTQMRIGHNHYLLLDQVRAFNADHFQRHAANVGDELSQKGQYSIRASLTAEGNPVVWNQSRQRYAVILDELGLVLNDINQAESIAATYDLKLTTRITKLKRAYYQVSAQKIPELMRRLQQDIRIREVLPSLLERSREPM